MSEEQNKMEGIQSQILRIISETAHMREELRNRHNKFQVTLTTALRILDRPTERMLEELGGKPEQIRAHLIRQALELTTEVSDVLTKIQTMLEHLQDEIRKQ